MAPELVKCGGKYSIYFLAEKVNWMICANNIYGRWSDPIKREVGQIDPGHIVGEDGKRYRYTSDGYRVPFPTAAVD